MNTAKSPKYRFIEVNFGGGYRQIVLDGLNYQEEEWAVEFETLTAANAATLEGYLLNSVSGTSTLLSWTPIGEGSSKYYTAHDVSKTPISKTHWCVNCKLRREFILS
jgi:phage-related protein